MKGRLSQWVMEAVGNELSRQASNGAVGGFMRAGVAGAAGMVGLGAAEVLREAEREAMTVGSELVVSASEAAANAVNSRIDSLSPRLSPQVTRHLGRFGL